MNLDDVADLVWFAKVMILIGIWVVATGPVYLLQGETSGKGHTALAFIGTLGWIGAISLLIQGGLL